MGYKAMHWDGTQSLYKKGFFLTGLLDKVTAQCREAGIAYEIQNNIPAVEARFAGSVGANMLEGVELYDYQVRAINECLAAKRGVVKIHVES